MDFTLIETFRYEPGQGPLRIDQHMKRLARSADALRFRQPAAARKKLDEHLKDAAEPLRVRLTLTPKGEIDITSTPFTPLDEDTVWTLRVAQTRLDSADPLLRHKTSKRDVYEAARAEYSKEDADEVLLLNELGDVCEGTITSIFVEETGGPLMTPPLNSGLLSGVFRTDMIYRQKARSQRLRLQDLRNRQIFLGNSLRGLIRAQLITD